MIRLTVDEFNSKLSSADSNFMLDDSDNAIDNFYELCLPDDESTGAPDEDLPSISKNHAISTIGESTMTLYISDPLKAFKNQEEGVNTTIQSIVNDANSNKTGAETHHTSHLFEDKGDTKASSKLIQKLRPNENDDDNNKVRYANQRCCQCVIF